MPDCLCPNCKTFFSAPSSAFGERYRCNACGAEYVLNVDHLARYQLPTIIHIQLRDPHGEALTDLSVPVMVDYGYHLPPLRSNSQGQILITREMFLKAMRDEILTGIMDHKGDYSLNRFIRIRVLARNEAIDMAKARSDSHWPILEFEKELYGDMPTLLAAYQPGDDIAPLETMLDLSKETDPVNVELVVSVA